MVKLLNHADMQEVWLQNITDWKSLHLSLLWITVIVQGCCL